MGGDANAVRRIRGTAASPFPPRTPSGKARGC